jgi:FAD/FMN-containing dehydrogenase
LDYRKEQLIKLVGESSVVDTPGVLENYANDHSFVPPMKPLVVVKPKDDNQVKGIVEWANKTGTPLVPVSSGPPHFHGDTVPGVPEAVIVDLSKMRRIIRIDRRNRMTMIEPGVTYDQLQPELSKKGLRLTTPLLPRSNKSVIASLLEREPTLVPKYQWAALDPLRCIEVVWGDANLFITGEAANQTNLEDSWKSGYAQVNPRGPGQTDFYKLVSAAQGTMGIVTWASIKCEVSPQIHQLFFVPSDNLNDLIGLTYKLVKFRFGDEYLVLNGSNLATIMGKTPDSIRALKEKLPKWLILIGMAGRDILPDERVKFQQADIAEISQQFGLQLCNKVAGVTGDEVLNVILNPSPEPYWKLRYRGDCQDIFFMTTLDKIPEFVTAMHSSAEKMGYPASDINVYTQPVHQGTGCHCEFSLPFDQNDKAEKSKVRELYVKASQELLKQGAFFSRPYGIWSDMVFDKDKQTTIVLKKLKQIFDPNNIMNPGKLCF